MTHSELRKLTIEYLEKFQRLSKETEELGREWDLAVTWNLIGDATPEWTCRGNDIKKLRAVAMHGHRSQIDAAFNQAIIELQCLRDALVREDDDDVGNSQ